MKKMKLQEWVAVVIALVAVVLFFGIGSSIVSPTDSALLGSSAGDLNLQEAISAKDSGLVIQDIVDGDGAKVRSGDTVAVYYIGRLSDGTIFDSTPEGGEPFTFTLGKGEVIAGWDEGVAGMNVGGRRVLIIPPELGYGANEIGPIPANSTLVFEVVLSAIVEQE